MTMKKYPECKITPEEAEQLRQVYGYLPEKDQDFTLSLLGQFKKYGCLSPKQEIWFYNMFKQAQAAGGPKIPKKAVKLQKLSTVETGQDPVLLKPAEPLLPGLTVLNGPLLFNKINQALQEVPATSFEYLPNGLFWVPLTLEGYTVPQEALDQVQGRTCYLNKKPFRILELDKKFTGCWFKEIPDPPVEGLNLKSTSTVMDSLTVAVHAEALEAFASALKDLKPLAEKIMEEATQNEGKKLKLPATLPSPRQYPVQPVTKRRRLF